VKLNNDFCVEKIYACTQVYTIYMHILHTKMQKWLVNKTVQFFS